MALPDNVGLTKKVEELTQEGSRYALIAADGCVPFRTTAAGVEFYDSAAVARTIERDIQEHGAPLVYRLDRASCHRTDEVDEVLAAAGVLRLHGQLDVDNLPAELEQMRRALNAVRPRPTLSYQTVEDMWDQRPELQEDRSELRDVVAECAARVARRTDEHRVRGSVVDFAQRIAIEQALTQRGYLHCQFGGWC